MLMFWIVWESNPRRANYSVPSRQVQGPTKPPEKWVRNTIPGAKVTLRVTFNTQAIFSVKVEKNIELSCSLSGIS
jgi:hypothetical protein